MEEITSRYCHKVCDTLRLTSFISGRRLKTIQIILMDMIMFSSQNNVAHFCNYSKMIIV